MIKYIFFPLWKIESLEKYLEEMEQKGYRLINVKYSYWFSFEESAPKEMCYFLSYKSFRGPSMEYCDYALLSKHNANPINSKMCYFSLYRTKESKDKLSLLYGARMDYIKRIFFEKALAAMLNTIIFAFTLFAEISTSNQYKMFYISEIFVGICACLTAYNLYGYFKQRSKCKKYERENKLDRS